VNVTLVRDIYFAVLGAGGVGKSTFITRCTGRQDVWTDGGIEPCKLSTSHNNHQQLTRSGRQ
jgi:ABC-type lipoprotein export system ATPase subunit